MLGHRPIASAAIAAAGIALARAATAFSWPMMWEGEGIPLAYVNTDAGDAVGVVSVAGASAWSDNPALCLADFMTRYGLTVDPLYLADAASYCDGLVSGAAGTEKRARMTLTLATKRRVSEWIETMRAYVPAWVVNAGDAWRIVADKPRATDHFFGPASINADNPPQITRGGTRDVPNHVDVGYTDTTTSPWQTLMASAEISNPDEFRPSRVDLPGIRYYSQARRFAVERLNHYTLEDVTGAISVFDEGLRVLRGDVCSISEPAFGWAGKLVRVLDAVEKETGRWDIQFREYDPAAYSSEVQTRPTMPDSTLGDPLHVVAPTNVAVSEVLAPESNLPPNGVGTGIIYQSRIRATWTDSTDPYISHYEIEIRLGDLFVISGQARAGTGVYVSPAVQQLVTYVVNVYAVNTLGVRSAATTANIFIDGKQFPPSNVPAISQAIEIGGEVLLTWEPAVDFDALRYVWRVDLGNTGKVWDAMDPVDAVDALRARFKGLAVGTHRFCVKATDSVGRESVNETCAVITITSDLGAFLQDQVFTAPTLNLMAALNTPFVEGESASLHPRWVTNDAARAWDTAMPSPIDAGVLPVDAYGIGPGGVAWWRGETHDIGFDLTADFFIAANITVWGGGVKRILEHSMDNVTFTPVDLSAGISWKGTARFVRPYFESVAAGAAWMIEGPPAVRMSAVERSENGGPVHSSATLATTITLANEYAKATLIEVQPTNASGARFPVIDNVVVGAGVTNKFDVYLFDSADAQRADDFYWTFKGT